jgi:hypothetical protein
LLLGVLFWNCKIRYTDIHAFIQHFTFPGKSDAGKNVFEKKSEVTKGSIVCKSSDGLGCYNLVRLFLIQKVMSAFGDNATVMAACLCYCALCDVLDLLVSKATTDPVALHKAVKLHLELFLAVYGNGEWIPKHHMALHLAKMLSEHGILLSCFTHERKHKEIKRYIPTRMSERSVLLEVIALQFRGMQSECHGHAVLHEPKPAKDALTGLVQSIFRTLELVLTAQVAVCATGLRVFQDDVVQLVDGAIAEVVFHVQLGAECMSCVSVWTQSEVDKNIYNICKTAEFVSTDYIVNVCTYRRQDGVAYVIPPSGFK